VSALLRIERTPTGLRFYARGQRVHHGRTGALIAGCGVTLAVLGYPPVGITAVSLGIALCWHDRHDFPWPFSDWSPA
jgi:hypothetical protein